ncbi:LPD25 domain-containing protein [Clostridium hydrogenum]|uniref:LPD25 domain-containing protein n=1 Tax=Clostridium hydrogenum TaxID=2855764 RepID=UPI001F3E40B1|nr:LPD25 domain-containing protein [Clostridium hydrogenum]
MKNDIKVTILEVENELVKDNFGKGQVISLREANERFKEIEDNPQWMIEDSKRLGINHPYTKVNFKVEVHDGKSINVRYSFGTHECKSLIDCIEGTVGYGQYLTENEKEFYKDFKNEVLLIKAAENLKKYISSLSSEALRNIYDKFHEIDRGAAVEMDVADKVLAIDVAEEKGKYKFDINDSRYVEYVNEVLKDTIKELIEHKPMEAMKILKDYITELKNWRITVCSKNRSS